MKEKLYNVLIAGAEVVLLVIEFNKKEKIIYLVLKKYNFKNFKILYNFRILHYLNLFIFFIY